MKAASQHSLHKKCLTKSFPRDIILAGLHHFYIIRRIPMKTLKKDLLFAIPMLVVLVLLFLLRKTGMPAHMALSFVGVAVLVAYTVVLRKEWKLPALEIVMRALYAIALITGIVIMNVHGIAALAIIHKATAALSLLSLIVLFSHKAIKLR